MIYIDDVESQDDDQLAQVKTLTARLAFVGFGTDRKVVMQQLQKSIATSTSNDTEAATGVGTMPVSLEEDRESSRSERPQQRLVSSS